MIQHTHTHTHTAHIQSQTIKAPFIHTVHAPHKNTNTQTLFGAVYSPGRAGTSSPALEYRPMSVMSGFGGDLLPAMGKGEGSESEGNCRSREGSFCPGTEKGKKKKEEISKERNLKKTSHHEISENLMITD